MSVITPEDVPSSPPQSRTPEHRHDTECCLDLKPFDHLSYLYGQVLTPQHLQRAQASVYEKLKLHNRCLHGWGVVCGLEVEVVPTAAHLSPESVAEDVQTSQADPRASSVRHGHHRKTEIWVHCGVAVDCQGYDLVVRERRKIDLYSALCPEDRAVVDDGQLHTLWVSACFESVGVERVRAAMADRCGGADSFYAFQRECVCIRVTLEAPQHSDLCETCCGCCDADCVVLARIDGFKRGQAVGTVDNFVRRPLTRYVPTRVSGTNWQQGATYTPDVADRLLWGTGLRVGFSRPVHADTLVDGVCDVYVHSRHNEHLWVLDGEIVLGAETPPRSGMVTQFWYKGRDEENTDPGDRILFVLRSSFVLDHCCMPIDGLRFGVGRPVAVDASAPKPVHERPQIACATRPKHHIPWVTGVHPPGSTFESWLFVEEIGKKASKREQQP